VKRKSKKSGSTRSSWTVTEARANFRNLLDKAQKQGPQTISRNGHPIATIAAAGGGRKSGR
jgi:antitoxin (DNA-binding transcriptional repressor) of toxin-antitoxin stability system